MNLLAALSVLCVACSATSSGNPPATNEPVITQVNNTRPTGSVAGRVFDFADGRPLADVAVQITAGATVLEPVTTSATGDWSIAGVPAGGTLGVSIKKDGYAEARLTTSLDDAAGNFPTENAHAYVGPVGLVAPSAEALEVTVLLPNGQPAVGVPVYLDVAAAYVLEDAAANHGLRGSTHETTTTANDGKALLVKVPAPSALATRFPTLVARLTVAAPVVVAGQVPVAQGTTLEVSYPTLLLQQNRATVVLPAAGSTTALKIVASDLPDFVTDRQVQTPGTLPASSVDVPTLLRLVFNQPVLRATVEAVMVGEDGSPLDPNGSLTRLEVRVPDVAEGMENAPTTTIALVLPRVTPGVEGNLHVRAASATGSSVLSVSAPVYFEQPAALAIRAVKQVSPVMVADGSLSPGETVDVYLNQAVGGRTAMGTAATSTSFLAVLVTVNQVLSSFVAAGEVLEPNPRSPHTLGGFTTRVRFTIPADVMNTFTYDLLNITLEFNDSARRDGGPVGGGALTVVTPGGVPVSTVSGTALMAEKLIDDVP